MRTRGEAKLELVQDVLERLGRWPSLPDRELDCRICYAVGYDWQTPEVAHTWRDIVEDKGYEAAWVTEHVYGRADGVPDLTASFDAVWRLMMDLMPQTDHVNINVSGPGSGAEIGVWVLGRPEADGGPYIGFKAKGCDSDPVIALLEAVLRGYVLRLEAE